MNKKVTKKGQSLKETNMDLALSPKKKVIAKSKISNDEFYELVGTHASNKSNNSLFGKMIYNQLLRSCRDYNVDVQDNTVLEDSVKTMLAELKGIEAKDQIEGMLAVQMIATHHATMDCFRIAVQNTQLGVINPMLCIANKLSRTFTMQIETLNRYRGKGQQKMTVEHVHINSGGQAIIGNLTKSTPNLEGEEEGGK